MENDIIAGSNTEARNLKTFHKVNFFYFTHVKYIRCSSVSVVNGYPWLLEGAARECTVLIQNNGGLLLRCLSVRLSVRARSNCRVRGSHPYSAGKR